MNRKNGLKRINRVEEIPNGRNGEGNERRKKDGWSETNKGTNVDYFENILCMII